MAFPVGEAVTAGPLAQRRQLQQPQQQLQQWRPLLFADASGANSQLVLLRLGCRRFPLSLTS